MNKCVSLQELFLNLDPDVSNFAMSMRAPQFLAEVLGMVREAAGAEVAASMCKAEQLPLAAQQLTAAIGLPEAERQAHIDGLAAKYSVPFLAAVSAPAAAARI